MAEDTHRTPLPARRHLSSRLAQQLEFLVEVDRLKSVLRQTLLTDKSRRENSAEHTWHLALMASVLAEHATETVDVGRVVQMILLHDIVEIDAGDTFAYDASGYEDKDERERAAARRIFGMLPEDQSESCWTLWREFEDRETMEARFANALDRLQPMLHNVLTDGHTWQQHGIVKAQVVDRNKIIAEGAPELWEYVERFLEEAVAEGILDV
ncbi:MAG: HD domain-containing protein [Acidobacteriota bacterium]